MYFGSVRFFKHLITTVVILLICGLAAAVCLTSLELRRVRIESEEYQKQAAAARETFAALVSGEGKDTLTAEQVYAVITNLGTDKREIVNLLYKSDKADFEDVFDMAYNRGSGIPTKPETDVKDLDDSGLEPISTTPAPGTASASKAAAVTTTAAAATAAPAYTALYPEMVVSGAAPATVSDDDTIYMTFDDGPS